jgi:hypothetical protein
MKSPSCTAEIYQTLKAELILALIFQQIAKVEKTFQILYEASFTQI